jgi:hypothetical protein
MSRRSARCLQVVTVLVGIGALALLLGEPHVEGRNAHATLTQIYLDDPFLAYVYVGSVPFFVGLYQAFRMWGWVASRDDVSADRALHAARLVRWCAGVALGFIAVGVVILMFVGEERPPAAFMGFLAMLPVLTLGACASAYERRVRADVDVRSRPA